MSHLVSATSGQHLKAHRAGDLQVTQLGRCQTQPEHPMIEAIKTAKEIRETWPSLPIKLCLSGGADSMSMAEAFLRAGVPFKAAILKMTGNLNFHDISEALIFCDRNQIETEVHEMDPCRFLEGEQLEIIAHRYQCSSPMLAMHMAFLDQVEGLPVLAGNPPRFEVQKEGFDILLPSEPHLALLRYFEQRPGVPFFFLFRPELACSFFRLPVMTRKMGWLKDQLNIHTELELCTFSDNPIDQETNHATRNHRAYVEKCQIYREAGFTIQLKNYRKTGFDAIKRMYALKHPDLGPQAFEKLFRAPLLKLFPLPKKRLHLIHKADLGLDVPVSRAASQNSRMNDGLIDAVDP